MTVQEIEVENKKLEDELINEITSLSFDTWDKYLELITSNEFIRGLKIKLKPQEGNLYASIIVGDFRLFLNQNIDDRISNYIKSVQDYQHINKFRQINSELKYALLEIKKL
jgi:hypothetical protein